LRGIEVARRLAVEGAVAGIGLHPRHASQRHKGRPDYALAARVVEELPVPVLISGGLQTAEQARTAFEQTGAEAVLLARGSLGNPWLFEELLGRRSGPPSVADVLAEVDWVMDSAVAHLGEERAARYLRKFYPWYLERLGGGKELRQALQTAPTLEAARALFCAACAGVPASAAA
jgi:tRNA-dihydrouridine synthase